MVACDSWESSDGWCEVLTLAATDLPLVSELARERVDALEAACSHNRPDSELTTLVAGGVQPISRLLASAVAASLRATEFTDGLVTSATGPPTVVAAEKPAREQAGLVLDQQASTLVLAPGLHIDPVPIARAWAADWIAEACLTQLGIGCLVNLGGNISARGESPTGGWRIHIDDGQPSATRSHTIAMTWSGGLASATAAAPHWPSLSAAPPGRHWRSVTVAAHSCERAKAASLAALELRDAAPRWLTQRELPARLVHTGGVTVQTPGWPTAD